MSDLVVSSEEINWETGLYECLEGAFAEAVACGGYAKGYFSSLGEYLRDRFYFPLKGKSFNLFIQNSKAYAEAFVKKLQGKNPHPERVFPRFEEIREKFDIKDVPITIRVGDRIFHFTTRIVESKDQFFDRKLRFVLFSFYDHMERKGEKLGNWDPKSTDELSGAVLEVLKQVQTKFQVDSLMTFSIGNIVLDGLKNLELQEGKKILPKNIIVNRGLTSIEKVSNMLFDYPISRLLYYGACLLQLNADPEQELLNFFERLSQDHPSSLEGRSVRIIEMSHDCYFAGLSGFGKEYHKKLSQTGVESYRGTFFVPGFDEKAHHSLPMHLIPTGGPGAHNEHFPQCEEGETLADHLMRTSLFSAKGGEHTLFMAGGNLDNLDSITCLQVAPFLSSFVRLSKSC